MPKNCWPASFSTCSLGSCQSYPASSCGSSSASVITYSMDFHSLRPCQLGHALSSGCQNLGKPTSCLRSYVVTSPCQMSCSHPRTPVLCSPFQTTYAVSQGSRSTSSSYKGYGSESSYPVGGGTRISRPPVRGGRPFPSLNYVFGFCHPNYLTSNTYRSSCYR